MSERVMTESTTGHNCAEESLPGWFDPRYSRGSAQAEAMAFGVECGNQSEEFLGYFFSHHGAKQFGELAGKKLLRVAFRKRSRAE